MRFRTDEGRLWWRREAQHRNEVVGVPRCLEPHAANTPHHPHDDDEEGEPDRLLDDKSFLLGSLLTPTALLLQGMTCTWAITSSA